MISRPEKNEYPEWFAGEIDLVPYDNLLSGLQDSLLKTLEFLRKIPETKLNFRYAAKKWTIKEIWQHVIDVERILGYRALRYARQDATVLHGFDEKSYASLCRADNRKWDDLIFEYIALRTSTIWLFKSFDGAMTLETGTTGKSTMTVRSVGYLILGHEIHHVHTIKEKYLEEIN